MLGLIHLGVPYVGFRMHSTQHRSGYPLQPFGRCTRKGMHLPRASASIPHAKKRQKIKIIQE
jgi:hypothetical protein